MLWDGFVYYHLFICTLAVTVAYALRGQFWSTISQVHFLPEDARTIALLLNFLFATTYSVCHQTLSAFGVVSLGVDGALLSSWSLRGMVSTALVGPELVSVYTYPFTYVFLLITTLSVLFCLTYNADELASFTLYCTFILLAGYLMFCTQSVLVFFLAYELLLLPSFFILYKFAKSRRSVEAAYLMFIWTQFGALFLIAALLYMFLVVGSSQFTVISNYAFAAVEVKFIFALLLVGFGVKLPVWPFYGWLPKAHVEASTNFSIFLSGVLVKFAFFGLLKLLLTLELEPRLVEAYPFLLVGMVEAVFKLFYQIDLKKLVAYSTVVEMHWLVICVISGQSPLIMSGLAMMVAHALMSTGAFLVVDAIARRYKTRLITEIGGLCFLCPKLFLITLAKVLVFLGFPGSLFFVSEFMFFSFMLEFLPLMAAVLILLLYLIGPIFLFRSWMNIMFGFSSQAHSKLPTDLSLRELLVLGFLLVLMFWLGLVWPTLVL